MIAYVLHGERDLRAEERPVPVAQPGEVVVRARRMGICGSDVHYFATGHCGAFVPRRPFVLGHEIAGEIVGTGQRVAVDPSRPCGGCKHCRKGRSNLCPEMRYLGSASTDPHVDGAFASFVAVPAANCHPLSDDVTDAEAALLEPLSVATHAAHRAGALEGRSVLVMGGGTIGQLLLQVARAANAARVVVTDVRPKALDFALEQGADEACLASDLQGALRGCDVIFEASGSPEALRAAMEQCDQGATIVQVGTLPEGVALPTHLIMQKELQLTGSFRFANVFSEALELLASHRVNVEPIVTHTFEFGEMVEAFECAVGSEHTLKIQVEG